MAVENVTVALRVHPWRDCPRGWLGLPALRWHTPGQVHVWRPALWLLFPLCGILHELAHEDLGGGNETHHPWHHFCVRSPQAIRFNYHATRHLSAAIALRRDGVV